MDTLDTLQLKRIDATPCRYGTREVAKGDVLEIPTEVARQLVAKGGWVFVDSPSDSASTSDAAETPTRRARGRK